MDYKLLPENWIIEACDGSDQIAYKRATCRACGSINEYLPNEERELYKGRDISGCMCTTKGFNCGNCGQEVVTYAD